MVSRKFSGERIIFLTHDARKIIYRHKRVNSDLTLNTKINLRWISDLNVKAEISHI